MMKQKRRYLSVEELLYLSQAPRSLILEILRTPAAQTHLPEIEAFASWDRERQRDYLVAKHRLQEVIKDETRHDNFVIDLSSLQLETLPPEIHFVMRRAKRFRLDLSGNNFNHYYSVRRAISRDQPDHPFPFDAINLADNPIEDLSPAIVQRGKESAHYLEEYWLRHWAKPYTIAKKFTHTMEMQRFTASDVVHAMKLVLHMTGVARAAEVHQSDDGESDEVIAVSA
ncbi:MAG: hypothetical protein AAFX93_05845 [Verrucomicrobiota bacterium]